MHYLEIPDTWLLDAEPDERDKAFQDLLRRVSALERVAPVVDISSFQEERQIKTLEVERVTFQPLAERTINELVAEVITLCPMPRTFGMSGTQLLYHQTIAISGRFGQQYQPPTAEEIEQYREEHAAWENQVREFFVGLPTRSNRRYATSEVKFRLQNNGSVPATSALVKITAHGGALIRPSRKQTTASRLKIPVPPRAPFGHFDDGRSTPFFGISDLNPIRSLDLTSVNRSHQLGRDRNVFYWKEKTAKPTNFLSLECAELRHQTDPELVNVTVSLPHSANSDGSITLKFSAANLPIPSTLVLPVMAVDNVGDTKRLALQLVEQLVREIASSKDETSGPNSTA